MFCAQVIYIYFDRKKINKSLFLFQWNHICHSSSNDRRTCPIFRIERGTFEESHNHILNSDYSATNEDEHVLLRITRLSSSGNPSPQLATHHHQLTKIFRDKRDDSTHRLVNENSTKSNRTRKHSLSDDYVFL